MILSLFFVANRLTHGLQLNFFAFAGLYDGDCALWLSGIIAHHAQQLQTRLAYIVTQILSYWWSLNHSFRLQFSQSLILHHRALVLIATSAPSTQKGEGERGIVWNVDCTTVSFTAVQRRKDFECNNHWLGHRTTSPLVATVWWFSRRNVPDLEVYTLKQAHNMNRLIWS